MTRRSFGLLPLAAAGAPLLPTKSELDEYLQRLEKALLELVAGVEPLAAPREIVTESRTVWFHARMARWGHESRKMLAAAEHGYSFLRETMWDHKNGGFQWEVDAAGKATKRNKHVLGQSVGLLAAAEYALASRRKDALDFAMKIFDTLERRAHDPVHGGYVEYFLADWSTPPVNEPIYVEGSATGMKLMETHLSLMEAMTTLYQASRSAAVRERLIELLSIETNAVVRKPLGACTDKYDRDWSPRVEGEFARVSYGRDLENLWQVTEAARATGLPFSPYVDLFTNNFAYCRKYGFDEERGGFYTSGGFNQPASDRNKTWRAQAEGLVSALTMYQITNRTEYFEVFRKTWGYWRSGANQVEKSPFYQGRALIECLARLRSIREKTA